MNYRDEYYQILAYIRKILEPKMGLDSKILLSLKNTKIANIQYFICFWIWYIFSMYFD